MKTSNFLLTMEKSYCSNITWLICCYISPLSANPTKWSNTLKQLVGKLRANLSVFDHFVKLVLKGSVFFTLCYYCFYLIKTNLLVYFHPQPTTKFILYIENICLCRHIYIYIYNLKYRILNYFLQGWHFRAI